MYSPTDKIRDEITSAVSDFKISSDKQKWYTPVFESKLLARIGIIFVLWRFDASHITAQNVMFLRTCRISDLM